MASDDDKVRTRALKRYNGYEIMDVKMGVTYVLCTDEAKLPRTRGDFTVYGMIEYSNDVSE